MKRSKFSGEQVAILKPADAGMKVREPCRKRSIPDPTYYNWNPGYGGMEAPDLKRVREPEGENLR